MFKKLNKTMIHSLCLFQRDISIGILEIDGKSIMIIYMIFYSCIIKYAFIIMHV